MVGTQVVGHSSLVCSLLEADPHWWVGLRNQVDQAIFGVEDRKRVDNC